MCNIDINVNLFTERRNVYNRGLMFEGKDIIFYHNNKALRELAEVQIISKLIIYFLSFPISLPFPTASPYPRKEDQ